MTFPLQGQAALFAAIGFGFLFGLLLHRGRLASYNTIIGQLRLKDFTIAKVMLTAIIIGGIGVYFLVGDGMAKYHVKSANLLAVAAGAVIFGIGMALYGYCPGTAITAIGTGSLHALVGFIGMIAGGIVYALSFDWLKANVIPVAQWGKVRLPDVTGVPDLVWFAGLAVMALAMFVMLERAGRKR